MNKKIYSSILVGVMAVSVIPSLGSMAFAKENSEKKIKNSVNVTSTLKLSHEGNEDEKDDNGKGLKIGHIIGEGNIRKGVASSTIAQNPDLVRQLIERLQSMINQLQERLQAILGQQQTLNISGVNASNVSSSTVSISWNSNIFANSKIYYSTSSPVNIASSSVVSDNSLVLNHSFNLTNLTSGTTYYFIVESVANGNTIRSSQSSFTTPSINVNPVISNVSITNVSTTSAQINWLTDKSATSQVNYSTTSPVSLSTSTAVLNNSLVTNHSVVITGLSASTTYYFVVQSSDASAHNATSSQNSFVTLP
jgi:hypothetical protein